MKKRYEKPAMKVVLLKGRTQLLSSSDPDYWGRIPGQPTDENHLA